MLEPLDRSRPWRLVFATGFGLLAAMLASRWTGEGFAQEPAVPAGSEAPADDAAQPAPPERLSEAETLAEKALSAPASSSEDPAKPAAAPVSVAVPQLNAWELTMKGGLLMYPIFLVSLIAVTFTIERAIGLRRSKVLPPRLLRGLADLSQEEGGFNPRQAYKLCQRYPCAAANVIKATLLKVGRPHSELEHTLASASEREANRLYSNVRWLSLATGIAPLLGLLGTVSGMIKAFFVTAHLPVGANKAEFLAGGIYEALVTTFAGLTVAIPAAVVAHFFEGRIQRLFRELDEALMGLMPQLERFEGRLRISPEDLESPARTASKPAARSGGAPKIP